MTQIVSTLASLLQGAWHPCHIPAYPLLTDDMFPLDLMQNLVPLLAPDTEAFLTVFSPLVQHCQQEAASIKLVSSKSLLLSLSKLMDLKTSSGSRQEVGHWASYQKLATKSCSYIHTFLGSLTLL